MKSFLFLLLLITDYCLLITTSFALDPVIVDSAEHVYCTDQNCVPNTDPQEQYVKEYTISQTFTPELDAQGQAVTSPTNINSVTQNVGASGKTNDGDRNFYYQFSQPFPNPLAPVEDKNRVFRTMTLQGSNSTRRMSPRWLLNCRKSNRLVQIATAINGGSSLCTDRTITGTTATVGEVFYNLIIAGQDKLYYPDSNCPMNQTPASFPADVIQALNSRNYPTRYSLSEYLILYRDGVEATCDNSTAVEVTQCNTVNGAESACKEPEIQGNPLGGLAQRDNFRQVIPVSGQVDQLDYAQTIIHNPVTDVPNPVVFNLAQAIANFFNGILDSVRSFSGPIVIKTNIATEAIDGYDTHTTAAAYLFPSARHSELTQTSPSTVGEVPIVNPGSRNADLVYKQAQLLQPRSWKQ